MSQIPAVPGLGEMHAAQARLVPHVVQTPLVRLRAGNERRQVYLKLENLQPIGAFKIRCMGNALLAANRADLAQGVYTASSGNAGLGLAWIARELGVPARVYAPESAPAAKLEAIRKLGAKFHRIPGEDWWQIILSGGHADDRGKYIDAVRNTAAIAGNATIGLEIVEAFADVETVIVPFGGGGLASGIAAAVRAIRPDTRIIVAESDTAAPLSAAFAAGRVVDVKVETSFISGAGAPRVLDEMWPLLRELVDDTIVVPAASVAAAVKLLFEHNRIVAEGAGAIAVAAALSGDPGNGRTVCVVSGGNIDAAVMAAILQGQSV